MTAPALSYSILSCTSVNNYSKFGCPIIITTALYCPASEYSLCPEHHFFMSHFYST